MILLIIFLSSNISFAQDISQDCSSPCINGQQCICQSTGCTCITPIPADTNSSTPVMGIDCDQDKLVNGQCKLNIYDTLGIRKSVRNENDPTSVGLFVQDVVLSATFFI